MMDKQYIQTLADDFVFHSTWNRIQAEEAITPELAGIQIFAAPLIGYSDLQDPLYKDLRKPEAVGPHVFLPEDWLPACRSVISYFFPFTEEIRKSNRIGTLPSSLWLHGRVEGQRFLIKFAEHMVQALQERDCSAVVPILSPAFQANTSNPDLPYGSNWSERHVAFISGLGTFGLSKGLITEKGTAGRFLSLVTDIPFEATERSYKDLYEYCIQCGACIRMCPAKAISMDKGKEHRPCSVYQNEISKQFTPRYGCGKCQVQVPCEFQKPSKTTGI